VLLYRECLNEYGWLKRRETYQRAGMLDEDVVLRELKRQEDERDALDKENAEAEMKDEAVDSEIDQSSDENMADSDG